MNPRRCIRPTRYRNYRAVPCGAETGDPGMPVCTAHKVFELAPEDQAPCEVGGPGCYGVAVFEVATPAAGFVDTCPACRPMAEGKRRRGRPAAAISGAGTDTPQESLMDVQTMG